MRLSRPTSPNPLQAVRADLNRRTDAVRDCDGVVSLSVHKIELIFRKAGNQLSVVVVVRPAITEISEITTRGLFDGEGSLLQMRRIGVRKPIRLARLLGISFIGECKGEPHRRINPRAHF